MSNGCCKPIDEERRKESESLSSWTYWRSLISIAPPLFSRERKAKSILLWGQLLVSGFFGAYIMSFLGKNVWNYQKKNRNSSLVGFFSPLPSVPAVWINHDDDQKNKRTLYTLEVGEPSLVGQLHGVRRHATRHRKDLTAWVRWRLRRKPQPGGWGGGWTSLPYPDHRYTDM